MSPPQQDRSVASRWRPELDSTKSAGERVAATGKCSSPAGISDPEGEGYLTPSGGEPELDNAKSAGERLLPEHGYLVLKE
ncbi:hypothetical protein [Geobacillus sp. FJAT-46040]|uniref:hypothetical protein n=1 Tax=Geobacillus sp. FJAT-46040 TaxID=2011017 RepID=UPI000BB6D53D|nr:hypothetical protein [Geobacillus sp. FJAT-46040]